MTLITFNWEERIINWSIYTQTIFVRFGLFLYLIALIAQSERVWVAGMIEETHGRKNGPSYGNNVELGHIVVFEQTFRHFQSVGGGNLKVPEE